MSETVATDANGPFQCCSTMLKATSATCVHYVSGDTLGKLLAYGSLIPYITILHAASVAYNQRQVHMVLVVIGFVFTEAVARVSKHVIGQPRPQEQCKELDTCGEFGMPSSHTACMAFATAIRALLLLRSWKGQLVTARVWGVLENVGLVFLTCLVAISRVYLGYHTQQQVLVAVGFGCVLALCWYGLMHVLLPVLGNLTQTRLGKLLMLTNTWTKAQTRKKRK